MADKIERLHDKYKAMAPFESMLEDARMNARNDWEEEFVASVIKKYEEYGSSMFWSGQQDTVLRRIAGPDD